MERIVFLDRDSIRAEIRAPAFAHVWQDYAMTAPEQIPERLAQATIAITNKVPLRQATLAQLDRLRYIAVCATGTDNVDLGYCRERGIAVSNIRNYAVHSVPEHVFMLVLALRRNLIGFQRDIAQGLWQQAPQFCLFTHPIEDLHGATLGVIGYGALGQAVAHLGAAFGMQILVAEQKGAASVRAGRVAFETVLRQADVVTLHLPLTPSTRHLIGAAELAAMKPSALLINTARGGLVDEQALAEALRAGRIGAAAFDVLSEEPPRNGNVLLDLDQPNFILTPHVAWSSRGAMQTMADQLVDNIESFVRGQPRNLVAGANADAPSTRGERHV